MQRYRSLEWSRVNLEPSLVKGAKELFVKAFMEALNDTGKGIDLRV